MPKPVIWTKEVALAHLNRVMVSDISPFVRDTVLAVMDWIRGQAKTELLKTAVPELPAGLMETLEKIARELQAARPPSDSVNEANLLRLTREVIRLAQAMVDSGDWKLPDTDKES